MKPQRIQLSRRKGWRMPEDTVKVDRTTGYGNPFVVGEVPSLAFAHVHDRRVESAAQAVALFRRHLIETAKRHDATIDALVKLRGKNLACWCKPGAPCHADVLLEFANLPESP